MKRLKRVLKWIAIVLGVLVLVVAGLWFYAFGKNSAIVDGREIAPGVESVKIGIVSAYVVDAGGGKVLLIDAGDDKKATAILAALSRRGLSREAVAAIFVTHGHIDHVAGCPAFPAARVYAMGDVDIIGDRAKVTDAIKDGDVVAVGETRVEAFAVPGHTPGSAAYLARNVLFFGDSAGASKDGTVMKAVGLFSKDSAQNVASLKALIARLTPRAADVKTLAFAHTGPLEGFAPLTAFASIAP
jgi:metallo-beta-lactamase class B